MDNIDDIEELPLAYSIDNAILMHRDVHFGGSFPIMLDYYSKEGRGINQEFDIERIKELYLTEQQSGKNLAALMLSGSEAEKIAKAREKYKQLRDLCEKHSTKNRIPILIANLILAEEEETEQAINEIVEQKSAAVPALIDILRSEDLHDALFPGYGLAPALATQCLGMIGDKRAIISLFELIGEGDFFNEDSLLDALYAIGTPAKEFLLKVLHGRPLNLDNERAAIALTHFTQDSEVASACFKMLQEPDVLKTPLLPTYLALACEGLSAKEQRDFIKFSKNPVLPTSLQKDMQAISKTWS